MHDGTIRQSCHQNNFSGVNAGAKLLQNLFIPVFGVIRQQAGKQFSNFRLNYGHGADHHSTS
jgi:hypothetical protein